MISALPNKLDSGALEALLAYWLHRAGGNANQDFETLSHVTGIELIGMKLQTHKMTDDGAFYLGFEFAKECIAAVLSDPIGNPSGELRAIAQKFRNERNHFEEDAGVLT